MLKIGDFSHISQVSVKTLRYYDELGLLKPATVDRFTGYRYYAFDQLPRLYRILALKDLGLSLQQITQLLQHDLPVEQLRGMLRLKQAEIEQQAAEVQGRLARVAAWLQQIEQETHPMTNPNVVLKKIDPVLVAGTRGIIPRYSEQGSLWEELEGYLHRCKVTPSAACFTIYYSDEPTVDAEVCEPLAAPCPATDRIQVHRLPGVETMASVIHHGPFETIGEAYKAILQWIEANHYRCVGPVREHYLKPPEQERSQTDPNTVTEIQFPVEKAA